MTTSLHGDTIHLSGACLVEEAETLLGLLQADRRRSVDLSCAELLHTAVLQVLLAFAPAIVAPPPDLMLAAILAALPPTPAAAR